MKFSILGIISRMPRVVQFEGRGGHIEAASPELHLLFAHFSGRLTLVKSLQCAVVPLVETPALDNRYPHKVHLLQHEPEGPDRPLQHRSVRNIEGKTPFAE